MLELSLQELEYVAAVEAERNITRAAQRCYIAQPALSQAILRIERKLGVRLFERSSRRVVPTPAGRLLAAEANDILASVQQAIRAAREAGGAPEPIRVHVSEPSLLTPRRILAAMRANVPHAAVQQTTLPVTAVRDQLIRGTLSLAIAGRVTGPGLHSQLMREEPVGALISDQHPLASADEVTVAQVADYPLLSVDETMSGWNQWVERLFAAHQATPTWTPASIFGIESGADILEDATTVLLTLESVSREHLQRLVWKPLRPNRTVPWFLTTNTEHTQRSSALTHAITVATRLASDQGWIT